MTGIRVRKIVKEVRDKHLKIYFSKPENGGGKIHKIYYPVFNNDAVILFEDKRVLDNVLKKEHRIGNQSVEVEALPEHMLFASVEARLDASAAVILQVTQSLRDEMELVEGIGIISEGDTCVLKGNWFQLEWAWHYLDNFMQQQEIIQSQISQQPQRSSATPMDFEEYDTSARSSHRSSSPTEVNQALRRTIAQKADQFKSLGLSPRTDPDNITGDISYTGNTETDRYRDRTRAKDRHADTFGRLGFDQHQTLRSDTSRNVNADAAYPSSIGVPKGSVDRLKSNIDNTYSKGRAEYGSYGKAKVELSESDDDLDLQGTGHMVPFESVHSTLNMGNRERQSDENSTFAQFSGLGLSSRSSPQQNSPQNSLKIKFSGSDYTAQQDRSKTDTPASNIRSLSPADVSLSSTRTHTTEPKAATASTSLNKSAQSDSLPERYSEDQLSQQFTVRDITVIVYYGDLLKEETDAIVNAANGDLDHMGGIAYAISKARGPEMERECKEIIRENGYLSVSDVVHTTGGGEIKATHIMHTYGPMWLGEQSRERVTEQLRQTFLKCFKYANDKLWIRSMALPAISTGVFGVPLDVCVRCFLDAILLFTKNSHETRRLREIHLVNRDAECTVTSIVLIQTLLDTGIDELTAEAVGTDGQSDDSSGGEHKTRLMNLPRGRPETTSSFSKTFNAERTVSATTASETTSVSAKNWVHPRRSSSLGRFSERKRTPEVDDLHISDYDKSYRGTKESLRSKTGSSVTTRGRTTERGRTNSMNMDASHRPKGREVGITSKLSSTISDSYTKTSSDLSRASKRPSTSESISKSAPKIKQSLMSTSNMKPMKSSSGIGSTTLFGKHKTSTLQAYDDYGAAASPRTYGSESRRTPRDYDDDYEFGMHSLPANIGSDSSFREKFLKLSETEHSRERCAICLESVKSPKILSKCQHKFCTDCIDEHFLRSKPTCPTCGMVYGAIKGTQPRGGHMTYEIKRDLLLPGYERYDGTIVITYTFPNGTQEVCHPNPGMPYKGITRKAYLPNTPEGREIRRLLKKAFDARLVFTVGESRTSGKTGVLTWNDIHHKTSATGGSTGHGYPDPTYLKRVRDELAANGITGD